MAVLGGIGAAAAWATAGMGATEITHAMKIHKESFQQDKRVFYADHTETVAHHGEQYAQSERHHGQGYAQGEAAYYQGDKEHRREILQARLQHRVSRDIAMHAEIREGLRDEFDQKNNRQNALMVCQAVMLTCAIQLAVVAELPWDTSEPRTSLRWPRLTWAYSATSGLAVFLLSLSLWCNFIATRRLNQYTAGVMQVEMHLEKAWRDRRGKDDVYDQAMLRDYFRRWFSRHCGFVAGISLHAFTCGVITVFFAATILIYMRFELRQKVPNAGLPFFFIICGTSLLIVGVESHERVLTKTKAGVYARPWANKLRSSLANQLRALVNFEEQSVTLGVAEAAPGLTEKKLMEQAVVEESLARRHCPDVASVARASEVTAKAARTETLLEKGWRMYSENELVEQELKSGQEGREWQRDPWISDVLTEVQKLGRARHGASDHKWHEGRAHVNAHGVSGSSAGAGGGAGDDDGESAADGATSQAPSRTPSALIEITTVADQDAIQMRKELGVYFRSTMVHITNATDISLHLVSHRAVSGLWYRKCQPPATIYPHTEVIFASVSRSRWVGGTEAEVSYDTRGEGNGSPTEIRMRWVNGMANGDRGRYCDVEVEKLGGQQTSKTKRGPTAILADGSAAAAAAAAEAAAAAAAAATAAVNDGSDTYFVTKDDDDQEDNSEVYFTVTSQKAAEEHASQFGDGSSYIQLRKGSSISAQETILSGLISKRRPDGLGLMWQQRFFQLTRSYLRYFRSSADTRAHAQLGQLALKNVIAVQSDEHSAEFVVVMANSQRAPYTLRADSVEEMHAWVSAIEMHSPRIYEIKHAHGRGGVAAAAAAAAAATAARTGTETIVEDEEEDEREAEEEGGGSGGSAGSNGSWLPAGRGEVADLQGDED
eukprot:COSAG06_NODE_364_length_16784_cov_21.917231_2_plen_887_part_00